MRRRGFTSGNGAPIITNSERVQPAPSPSTARPPEILSSDANSCASAAGVREKQLRIDVPISIFEVLAAIAASSGSGEVLHDSAEETRS